MEEPDKKDFEFAIDYLISESIITEQYEDDFELDYEAIVKGLAKDYQIKVPEYLPECRFIQKENGKYYIKKDRMEEAISFRWYNYVTDIFLKDSRKLSEEERQGEDSFNSLFGKLYIDFGLILRVPLNFRIGAQLLQAFRTHSSQREFQTKLTSLLNKILNETISPSDDITEYVEAAEPYKETIIGYAMGNIYTYVNGHYYLKEVNLFSPEFGMLFYCGMLFMVPSNLAEFLSKVYCYYKRKQ